VGATGRARAALAATLGLADEEVLALDGRWTRLVPQGVLAQGVWCAYAVEAPEQPLRFLGRTLLIRSTAHHRRQAPTCRGNGADSMTPTRPYGPYGFTRTPAVRALLDRYDGGGDEPERAGDLIHLDGITVADLYALARLDVQVGSDLNTLDCLFELAKRFPTMTVTGYRVPPSRDDERVTLTTCEIPWKDIDKDGLIEVFDLRPEEVAHDMDAAVLRVWWEA
jgi:hypothetical protein